MSHAQPRTDAVDPVPEPNPGEYVLGTGADELARLGLQHRLWSDDASAAWKRAGWGSGSRVLDVGCGPGYAAMDLAQLVGTSGAVVGVDESPGFVEYLNAQAKSRGLLQARGVVGDVQDLASASGLGTQPFDGAYARWVLCFVREPERVVRGVAQRLKPGGLFVVHDYFTYTTMTTGPRSDWHDRLVNATAKSWIEHGGDPDVGGKLPGIFNACGLDLVDLRLHHRVARGGRDANGRRDPMLDWPLSWWRTYTPKLVSMGLITQAQGYEAMRGLDELERDATRFVVCPPVFEIVGRKRA